MPIITFFSDFGLNDHYVSVVKAQILKELPQIQIVDICHQVPPFDLEKATFILKNAFRNFPKGTIHLVAFYASPYNSIDKPKIIEGKKKDTFLAISLEGHFFVGYDIGLFSLISNSNPTEIVELKNIDSNFIAKDVFAPACVKLAKGESLSSIGTNTDIMIEKVNRKSFITKDYIRGEIIYIDNYGNFITNISHNDYNKFLDLNKDKNDFQIKVSKKTITKINDNYIDVSIGELFVVFNSEGLMEIGIREGKASELMDTGEHIYIYAN